jgi:hypothetical protein
MIAGRGLRDEAAGGEQRKRTRRGSKASHPAHRTFTEFFFKPCKMMGI